MPVLPLVLFLTLTAGTDRTVPPGCREDHRTCREDCTIDYGSGTNKYKLLNECVARCDRERDACTTRFYSLRDTSGDLPSTRGGSGPESEQFEDPSRGGFNQDTERRGVYRANEPAAAPAPVEKAPAEDDLALPPEPTEPPAPPEPAEPPAAVAAPPPPAPAAKSTPEKKPAPEVKKKSPPARARGKQEEIRAFDDEEETPTEGTPPAAPEPTPPAKKKRSTK